MKCLANIQCKYIKEVDMFGKEPELYYKGRSKKTSWIGRILSFSFVILYFAFLLYKLIRMLRKVDVTFYDTYTYAPKPSAVKLSSNNFYGGFALEHPITYDVFVDESIYIVKAYFKRAERKGDSFEWTIKEIELERCKLQNFGSFYQEKFKLKPLNNLYCFKDIDFTLEGHFSYDVYSFFYIQFFPCVNTTEKQDCKPRDEIDFYLNNTFVSFLMEDIELTPKNYEFPIRARDVDIYTTVGKKLFKEIHAYFQVVKIETDMDFLGFDEFENIKTEVYLKYDEMFIMSNLIDSDIYETGESFCDFTIKLSENVRTERRTYTKLISILGDVGGFMEVLFTVFRIISSLSVDILYEISLVNKLFDFNINKKQIILKDFNNIKDKENEILKKEDPKIYIPKNPIVISYQNSITMKEEMTSANRINEETRSKNTNKGLNLKKKKHILKGSSSFYSNLKTIPIKKKNNNNEDNPKEIKQIILNTNESSNQEEKGDQKIIKKIRVNRACIYLCFCFVRRRKNMQNALLEEGMNIISQNLDIFNIFQKIYKEEKFKENEILPKNIIEMSDECKIKIRNIYNNYLLD